MSIPDGYSKEIPTEEGAWWMICMESDYGRDPVEVITMHGILYADHAEIGIYPVDMLHSNLTDVGWKRAMKSK